jgi:hypothetical protein
VSGLQNRSEHDGGEIIHSLDCPTLESNLGTAARSQWVSYPDSELSCLTGSSLWNELKNVELFI